MKNEAQVISECLSSIFSQSVKPKEVIVVDGRSTDDTLKKASQFPVKIISETEPTSLPNARNLGVRNAQSDIVLIIDGDVVLDKSCVENALKYFENQDTIAVIPSVQNFSRSHLEEIQKEWIHASANPIRSGIGIPVFAEFLRAVVFKKIEFDPNLGYAEDEDFQKRLKQLYSRPGNIIFASDSKIIIHYSQTLRELRMQYTWYGRTLRRYIQKELSMKLIMNLGSILAPMILLFLWIVLFFFPQVLILLVIVAILLVARNTIICYRSKSLHFFEYIAFEFLRSIFFSIGIIQGLFSKKKGH